MSPELARAIVIQNKKTEELFSGRRSTVFFNTRSAAVNAFNRAKAGRYSRGNGIFQSQDEWVLRTLIVTPDSLY